MCGIVGIWNYENKAAISEDILKKMRDTMIHRGPDGAGIWISLDRQIGLGHRRLSIIDLSEAANQPMGNEDESIWIVFNGEIYNHGEIRPELEQRGHKFKSDHSDTEVIIHAFEEWGEDCVHKFRGMFAFSIWDEKKKELWLFRDHIGIKPLYYTSQNGKFIFASEIKAILAHHDICKAIEEESFYHYLSFLTTPCPNTLFKGIKKLSPGCYLKVKGNGQIELIRYWDVWDHTVPLFGISEEEIADRLITELRSAVRYRKISDVPVGVFLSGGIDSSTNAALFSEGETSSIRTFSIGYDKNYKYYRNEFAYARKMAKLIKADHFEKQLNIDDMIDFLPKLIYHQDEPIADPVCVPIYYVSKLAKDNGIVVCQVGEGSDELFCGYPSWKVFLRLQKLNNLLMATSLKKMGVFLLKTIGKEYKIKYEWLRRAAFGEPIFWGGAEAFTEGEKRKLLSQRLEKKFSNYSSYEVLRPILKNFYKKARDKSTLNWMSYLDLNLRLPELLLMRIDKMSMINSLEARVPFLDHKFVELAMSIPEDVKIKKGILKYILKKSVRGIIPDELIDRNKQGFSVPIFEWFFDKLGDFTRVKVLSFTKRTDFFCETHIKNLLEKRSMDKLWCILNFVLWYEKWIEKNE